MPQAGLERRSPSHCLRCSGRSCRGGARPLGPAPRYRGCRLESSGGMSGPTCVVRGKDLYGSCKHGDPGFRTHAQHGPHRKLGVKWERRH
jgi:hypothetical protein